MNANVAGMQSFTFRERIAFNDLIELMRLIDSYLSIPYTNVKGLFRGPAKYFVGQSKQLKINHWESIRDMCRRASTNKVC